MKLTLNPDKPQLGRMTSSLRIYETSESMQRYVENSL